MIPEQFEEIIVNKFLMMSETKLYL